MADGHLGAGGGTTINRRQALSRAAAFSAVGVAAALPGAASATSPTDPRLRLYEGQYAIDSHKVVEGYFAMPRGRTALDALVVIPGENGIDEAVRDTVRRHALAGQLVFAPDLAKTSGLRFASREAMISEVLSHLPRMKRHAHGNGTVRVVAA